MNNIFSKVAASVLLAGLTISAASATSVLCLDGNLSVTNAEQNISIDLAGGGSDVNLTFVPRNIDATQASSFRMVFSNGGFDETKIIMCVGTTRVGNMYSKGDGYTSGLLTVPRFQFDSDANETLIQRDSNISFMDNDDCLTPATVSSTDGACQTVSAKIDSGRTSTGLDYTDYDTNSFTFGKTAQMVQITCDTPVCFITNASGQKQFGAASATGINQAISAPTADYDIADFDCYNCSETAQVCTANIRVRNKSTDFAVTGLDVTLNMVGEDGVLNNSAYVGAVVVDLNGTELSTTLGSALSINGLNIHSDQNQTLRIIYTPDTTTVLTAGNIQGVINGLDSNTTTTANTINTTFGVDQNRTLTRMVVAGQTEFTVPYMNASMKSFVRVATKSAVDADLEATITDNDGNKCELTLDKIPANGASVVWAHELKTAATTAGCSLTSDLYSVVFKTSAEATVVSYMRTKAGERVVNPF